MSLVRGPYLKNHCFKERQRKCIGPEPVLGAEDAEWCNHGLITPESLRLVWETTPKTDDYSAS